MGEVTGAHPSWMHNAACADAVDPEIFHPTRGKSTEPAKQFCRSCPVAGLCLNYALENSLSGVWGGTTGSERERMPRPPRREPTAHGTTARARAHRRAGEPMCAACRRAWRAAARQVRYRARQKMLAQQGLHARAGL